jgi:site-specific DNA-methyltransferase (adenine-specific)
MILENIFEKIDNHIKVSSPEIIKYGEVYTELKLVDEMLSILPDDFWQNPNLKILDPCNGIGNFPSQIINRLMNGLSSYEKNVEKRYKWIIENIIYISEIQPKNILFYEKLFNPENKYKMNIFSGSFFDLNIQKDFNLLEFDMIIGNPPYQQGVDSRSSTSIYDKFVDKSCKISKYVLMITPSRWYSNPSMSNFRNNMINNYGLKILINKGNIFKSVDIKGGVCYFLLEKNYKGECIFNGEKVNFSNNLITNDNILIDKIKKYDNFSKLLNSDQYFNIRNKDDRFLSEEEVDTVKCYVSKQNGNIKFIKTNILKITNNHFKYKVFLPTASGSKENIGELGRMIIGMPTEVSSRSFVHFAFQSYEECESFISYLNTDIIKKLIGIKKLTQLVKKDCFSLVPIIPLDRIWNNESVKKYFNL